MSQIHMPVQTLPSADPLLVRGLRVTWWYTFSGILFFEFVLMFLWVPTLTPLSTASWQLTGTMVGGLLWFAATIVLLREYHRITTTGDEPHPIRMWGALATGAVFAVFLLIVWGLWSVALIPLAQCILLLTWQPGVRSKVTIVVSALLLALTIRDGLGMADHPELAGHLEAWWFSSVYVCIIPAMSVFSLWWWDVVIRLDHARAAESRLAATQERLRLATDVHDLQGHHLQVIALQLELTERMLERDPAAALTHLKEARSSVDAARQGTRDLAKPFQSIPPSDEIKNAADLLTAAGAHVSVLIEPGAELAPAEVLGPVIRETTTNVLKHGGGSWARLSLARYETCWRYEISNDVAPETQRSRSAASRDGTGIAGMRRRLGEVGGSLEVVQTAEDFTVIVEVRP